MAMLISFLIGLALGVIGMKMTRKAPEISVEEKSVAGSPSITSHDKSTSVLQAAWYDGLGGEHNVQQAAAIAATRIRVSLQDGSRIDEVALRKAGVLAVAPINAQVFHLIVGPQPA